MESCHHMAQCEPFLFMPNVTLLRCHVASPYIAMCHPTPHASKNVKSRPPRNQTKFDVVTKFREIISTEKSVSSSEVYKNFGFLPKLRFYPFLRKLDFLGVSHLSKQAIRVLYAFKEKKTSKQESIKSFINF